MATTTPGLRHVKLYAVSSNADQGNAAEFSQSVAPGLLQCRDDENMKCQLLSFNTRYTFPQIQLGYNSGFIMRSQSVPTIQSAVNDSYQITILPGSAQQRTVNVQMPPGNITDQELIAAFNVQMAGLGITLTISYTGVGNWQFSSASPFTVNWTIIQPNTKARFGFQSAAYQAVQTGGSGPYLVQTSQDNNPYTVFYTLFNVPAGSPNLDAVITSLNNQLPGITVTDSDGTTAPVDALLFRNTNSKGDIFFDFSAARLQVSCAKSLGFARGQSYALGSSLNSPFAANITGPDALILSVSQGGGINGLPGSSIANFSPGSKTFLSTPNVLAIIPLTVAYNEQISFTPHSDDPGLQLVDRQVNSLSLSIRDPLGFSLDLSSMIYSICLLFKFERS